MKKKSVRGAAKHISKLRAEYFEVYTAMSGAEALEIVSKERPDIILLDAMMPGMDGFEVCRRLKENSATSHIPIVMVTALDHPTDKVKGLEAGADDFLTKPVNDIALFARVKNLVRIKMLSDELHSRAETSERMGLIEDALNAQAFAEEGSNILIVDDNEYSQSSVSNILEESHKLIHCDNAQQALFVAAEEEVDMILISLGLKDYDSLRLCSQIRSLDRTRNIPILVVVAPDEEGKLLRAFDIGVNDYISTPLDGNELTARVNTQLKRHYYVQKLRSNFDNSMEMAVKDSLTGLYNRRYMETHLSTLMEHSANRGKPVSLMIMDIDFFKSVNDTYGHDVGDVVLKEFAKRIKTSIRGVDMACRVGGEEFIVVLPETQVSQAHMIAERMRNIIGNEPFKVPVKTGELEITVSIGISSMEDVDDDASLLMKRADQALYKAKSDGRNRVVSQAA